ncbi:MAG: hypothetical protein QME51_02350 [Planctomycetota bacterium]|nr:hypothetical protein [Planctomycetota bacterium]MDI6787195.1 hypothetical protein [Planctomycetota bacterium]
MAPKRHGVFSAIKVGEGVVIHRPTGINADAKEKSPLIRVVRGVSFPRIIVTFVTLVTIV